LAITRLPHLIGTTALALTLLSTPASALDIVNEEREAAKIMIQSWDQVVGAGQTARFRPYQSPTLIKIELSHIRLQCEVRESDQVRLVDNNCYVNGELAGEGQFRMRGSLGIFKSVSHNRNML
jgi:hypothetical protein